MEIWKEIPSYEGLYVASNQGRIQSLDHVVPCRGGKPRLVRGKLKNSFPTNKKGYCITTLSKENKLMTYTVHQLIALTFIPGFIKGTHINHVDGVKTNNWLTNIEESNPSHNGLHAYRNGLSTKTGISQYHHVSYVSNPRAISKWAVSIRHNGKSSYGWKTFKVEEDAAKYADTLLDTIGDTDRLRNFPIL